MGKFGRFGTGDSCGEGEDAGGFLVECGMGRGVTLDRGCVRGALGTRTLCGQYVRSILNIQNL
jgi:hypothetical protein